MLTRDISAGLTVGMVALPLAMAFGIASGVPPEAGIYTAIIAGFLISLLGGCRVQIGGPAGAFIVAGIFCIAAAALFAFRKRLFRNTFVRLFIKLFYDNNE